MPTPVQNIAAAISAYNDALKGKPAAGLAPRDANPDQDFAALVKGAIREAVKIGERSEKLSIAAINDRADLNQVVSAVAEAEVTLQTVVAIRDRVLEAYKEVLRMPI
jgi:flagellar hook-basal body complex protein FliE